LDPYLTVTAIHGLWHDGQRRPLVRLCAVLTGDRDAAEDLAQETLLEAWRNAHKLHDPSGAERWVAAIARPTLNVCVALIALAAIVALNAFREPAGGRRRSCGGALPDAG
jgi:Sigma-70 region 2